MFNIFVIGPEAAGKTSFLFHYTQGVFDPERKRYKMLGVDMFTKTTPSEKHLTLWDTSADLSFLSTSTFSYPRYNKSSVAALLFLDPTEPNSLTKTKELEETFKKHYPLVTVFLVVSKSDQKKPSPSTLKAIGESFPNQPIYVISAATGEGVEELMDSVVLKLQEKTRQEYIHDNGMPEETSLEEIKQHLFGVLRTKGRLCKKIGKTVLANNDGVRDEAASILVNLGCFDEAFAENFCTEREAEKIYSRFVARKLISTLEKMPTGLHRIPHALLIDAHDTSRRIRKALFRQLKVQSKDTYLGKIALPDDLYDKARYVLYNDCPERTLRCKEDIYEFDETFCRVSEVEELRKNLAALPKLNG